MAEILNFRINIIYIRQIFFYSIVFKLYPNDLTSIIVTDNNIIFINKYGGSELWLLNR
jgi:hypothetical protein